MPNTTTLSGKIPPQNLDAEKSLLGAVLIDEETLADVSEHVTSKDFYDKSRKNGTNELCGAPEILRSKY